MRDGNTAALNTYLDDQERIEADYQEGLENFDANDHRDLVIEQFLEQENGARWTLAKHIFAEMENELCEICEAWEAGEKFSIDKADIFAIGLHFRNAVTNALDEFAIDEEVKESVYKVFQ